MDRRGRRHAGPYSNPALEGVNGVGPTGTLSEACTSGSDWPDNCDVTGATGNNSFLQYKGIFIRNLACLSQDVTGSPSYQAFISDNAATVFQDDQDTTTSFSAGADLNLFGFLWDNNGNAWPGTETAELNEATRAPDYEGGPASPPGDCPSAGGAGDGPACRAS